MSLSPLIKSALFDAFFVSSFGVLIKTIAKYNSKLKNHRDREIVRARSLCEITQEPHPTG